MMSFNSIKAICFVFLASACLSSASADVFFRIDSDVGSGTEFSPADMGTLSIFLEATGDDVGQPIGGYQVTAEVSEMGGADIADFTFTPGTAMVDSAFVAALATNTIDPGIPSFYSTAIGNATLSSSTPLVSIGYSIAPGSSGVGAFDIDVVASGGPVNGDTSVFGNQNFSFEGVELTLQGQSVPEPSAFVLLTGTCGLLMMRRRKRAI